MMARSMTSSATFAAAASACMARQAPVARDLRQLITVQLVISELERMGDHAAGIAKQVSRMTGGQMQPELRRP